MTQAATRGGVLVKAVLAIAVIGAVIAAVYFSFIDPYFSRMVQFKVNDVMSASSIPGELSHASYLLTSANGGGIYSNDGLAYPQYQKDNSLVLDAARAGGVEAALVYSPSSDTYEIRVGDDVLLSTGMPKKILAISEDGTRASVGVSATTYGTPAADEWTVTIVDLGSGTTWSIEGFAAPFKDARTVYAFRADGIYLVEYETGSEVKVLDVPTPYVYRSIAQNTDRTMLAWTTLVDEAFVYDVLDNAELPLALLFSEVGFKGTIALSDTSLYDIEQKAGGGTTITRHGIFDGTVEHVRTLPGILAISKLLP